jgi:hypothetical protein
MVLSAGAAGGYGAGRAGTREPGGAGSRATASRLVSGARSGQVD